MLKISIVLAVAVEQNQRHARALFGVMELDVHLLESDEAEVFQ